MLQVTLNVILTLEGPFLTRSSTPGRYGIDASMAVNHKGKYMIPGTLVKGRLRQSWEELKDAAGYISEDDIHHFLGKGSDEDSGPMPVEPFRGLLRFSDFVSDKGETHILHRIKMNEDRGAVETGQFLAMESPFAPGERACFVGTIGFAATDKKQASQFKDYVDKGLRWITSLGSERTVGFGKLVDVGISQDSKQFQSTGSQAAISHMENGKLCLKISPSSPFCIAGPRVTENLFKSEEVIPGGVIKGTIASMWAEFLGKHGGREIDENFDPVRQELGRCFEKIRFTHAFPAKSTESKRPVSFPLSLVRAKDDIYDVALCDGPVLINCIAPAFEVDWKIDTLLDVKAHFGWPSLRRELRVRTAIDKGSRKAKKGQLFAYESIIPDDLHWLGWVDLGLILKTDRDAVERQLGELLAHGLAGLGKTKAYASAKLEKPTSIEPAYHSMLEPLDDHYIVTLQTPAILCDPGELNEESDRAKLCETYAAVWSHLSENSLSLVRYFARQTLAGGQYLHKRFQHSQKYEPYLLAAAGSVFVLKVEDSGTAGQKIEEWYEHGLPLPEWARERYGRNGSEGDHWLNCPFIRENGYGEVAVNMKIHTCGKPEEVVECHSANSGA